MWIGKTFLEFFREKLSDTGSEFFPFLQSALRSDADPPE